MLVLTRKVGEKVIIQVGGEQITVQVVEIQGKSGVRLGFDAPDDVDIDREELLTDNDQETEVAK